MIMCLEGTSIWGEFQLGDIEGVFFMSARPRAVILRPGRIHLCSARSRPSRGLCILRSRMLRRNEITGECNVDGTFCAVVPNEVGERLDCDCWGHRTSDFGVK
ncbi:hypothetical protein BJX99DRAFT_237766 [Aspergillus californicus]